MVALGCCWVSVRSGSLGGLVSTPLLHCSPCGVILKTESCFSFDEFLHWLTEREADDDDDEVDDDGGRDNDGSHAP